MAVMPETREHPKLLKLDFSVLKISQTPPDPRVVPAS